MVRSKSSKANEVAWDPASGEIDRAALEGFDRVVHLAGENIAEGRWTPEKKSRIRDSRVKGTQLLAESLAGLAQPPSAFVCASAIGYYGDRADELLTESSKPGRGFLADVCQEWEDATSPAEKTGIRTVRLRIGVVLSKNGGALKKMLPPFKLGAGGKIGSGKQYMSWITLDDLVRVIENALESSTLSGAVNAVAPNPVTNLQFTKALGRAISRPAIFPLPAFAARIALGEMADALLLASTRVTPAKLLDEGFVFQHAGIEEALRHVLAAKD
jgi:uncharacterized protein (TIGR01777 family)